MLFNHPKYYPDEGFDLGNDEEINISKKEKKEKFELDKNEEKGQLIQDNNDSLEISIQKGNEENSNFLSRFSFYWLSTLLGKGINNFFLLFYFFLFSPF